MEALTLKEQYTQGFNDAYTLCIHEPDFLNTIMKSVEKADEYGEGLIAGHEQFQWEMQQERLRELDDIRGNGQERDLGREIDR